MSREWVFSAPLIAATGFPLSGFWHANAEGWVMGVYSSWIFFHMRSRGDKGGGRGWVARRRREPLVPEAPLGLVRTSLGPGIVLVEVMGKGVSVV